MSVLKDVARSCRVLLMSPGFTGLAVFTLVLGIGANSTVLSWINSTLIHPIPAVSDTAGLVSVTKGGTAYSDLMFSYPDYADLRDRTQSVSGLAAFNSRSMQITGTGKPERIWGTLASANYFEVLNLRPFLGRLFLPSEQGSPGGAAVVVISYNCWRSHFGANSSVVGKTININHHPYTIIGVASPGFQGSQTGLRCDMWIPVMMAEQFIARSQLLHDRGTAWVLVVGRLRPRISAEQAGRELTSLIQHIASQYPEVRHGFEIAVYPLWRSPQGANRALYLLLPALLAIAGVVLLLACTNVANLLLVRSIARRREAAIRLSLGASRWQMVRHTLLESIILAVVSGGVAMLLTVWTAGALARFVPVTSVPIELHGLIDSSVFVLTFLISTLTGVIFGILPALKLSGQDPAMVLKTEAASISADLHKAHLSNALVIGQISLSLLLLACAVLFIRSFRNAQHCDPGFNAKEVLVASYDLLSEGYSATEGVEFNRRLLGKLEGLPGVQSATLSHWVPLTPSWSPTAIRPEGYLPGLRESMDIGFAVVAPNYFRTMQIPIRLGREFTSVDTEKSQPVVVINEALAERYWPKQNSVSKRLYMNLYGREFSVIGVVRNANYAALNETAQPFAYVAIFQNYSGLATIHVRVSGDPMAYHSAIEATVHELNRDLLLYDVSALQDRIQMASATQRIAGILVGAFGLVALVLAGVGIYGVTSYVTSQRTREFGIRVALGAQRRDVLRLVLHQGIRLAVMGVIAGLLLSQVVTRFVGNLLFGITASDVPTFAGVTLVLCAVALVACYIPACRAMALDPTVILRQD